VFGPHGGTVELKQAAAFEHAVDDRLRQILVVQDTAPGR